MNQLNLKQVTLASALALVGSFPVVQEVEGAIFVKIPNIKGDVTTEGYTGEIEALSWQWGSASGKSKKKSFKLCMEEVALSKLVDRASADLMNHHSMGTRYPSAVVTVVDRSPGGPRYRYEFLDVVISNYSVSTNGSDLNESFGFNYSGVMGTLTTLNPTNGRYDVNSNFQVGPNSCK